MPRVGDRSFNENITDGQKRTEQGGDGAPSKTMEQERQAADFSAAGASSPGRRPSSVARRPKSPQASSPTRDIVSNETGLKAPLVDKENEEQIYASHERSIRKHAREKLTSGFYLSDDKRKVMEMVSAEGVSPKFIRAAGGMVFYADYGRDLSGERLRKGLALIESGLEKKVMNEDWEDSWRYMTPAEISAKKHKDYVSRSDFVEAIQKSASLYRSYGILGEIMRREGAQEYDPELAKKFSDERGDLGKILGKIGRDSSNSLVKMICQNAIDEK